MPAALIAVKLAGRRPLDTVFGTGPAPMLWTVLLAYLVALAVMFCSTYNRMLWTGSQWTS